MNPETSDARSLSSCHRKAALAGATILLLVFGALVWRDYRAEPAQVRDPGTRVESAPEGNTRTNGRYVIEEQETGTPWTTRTLVPTGATRAAALSRVLPLSFFLLAAFGALFGIHRYLVHMFIAPAIRLAGSQETLNHGNGSADAPAFPQQCWPTTSGIR